MRKKIVVSLALVLTVVLLAVSLSACIPSDPAKARENLEGADYVAVNLPALGIGGVDNVVFATKVTDSIVLVYFAETKDAKEFWNEYKDNKEGIYKAFGKSADKDSELKAGRSGKVVYVGTAQAVKDAK